MKGRHIETKVGKQFTLEVFCIKVSGPVHNTGDLTTYRHIVFENIFGNRFIWNRRETTRTGDPTPPLNVPLQLTGFVKRHTEDIEQRAATFIERATYSVIKRDDVPTPDSH